MTSLGSRRCFRRLILLGATSLCGVGLVPAATWAAQTQAAAEAPTVGEIIVTARKRAESLQAVPMSISAYTGDALNKSGYADLSNVSRVAPNVYFEAADRSRPLIYIRGIGTRSYDGGSDPSVGVFIDGVYQGRFGGLDVDLDDVQRVEVLKGPQGTLYGRNTIGGAVSVITKEPTKTFSARAYAEYGGSAISGDSLYSVGATLSGPVVADRLGAILSVERHSRDGYQPTRFANGVDTGVRGGSEDSWGVRGKLNWTPTDQLKVKLAGDYTYMNGPPLVLTSNELGQGLGPGALAPGYTLPTPSADPYHPYSDVANAHLHKTTYGGALTTEWTAGRYALTSISAARKLTIDELNDLDGTPLPFYTNPVTDNAAQVSEELRASYTGDRVTWLLGAYYGHETDTRTDGIVFGPASLLNLFGGGATDWSFKVKGRTTSYAVFGQLHYALTDRLSATLGARYSDDGKTFTFDTANTAAPLVISPFVTTQHRSWNAFDPSVSLDYKITTAVMAYASWSTGYKSGAFQFIATSPAIANQIADPESVDAYETGIKSTLFDHRLRLNVAGFYMDYKNLQQLRLVPGPGGTAFIVINNAAASTIYGIEAEGRAVFSSAFSLDFSYAYLHARFDKYPFAPGEDFSGNRMPRAPENSFSLAPNYTLAVGPGRLDARVSYTWRDKIFFEADNNAVDPQSSESPLGLVDGSVAYTQGAWTVALWGRNLTDERYRRQVLNSTGSAQRQVWAEPRTVGLRISCALN